MLPCGHDALIAANVACLGVDSYGVMATLVGQVNPYHEVFSGTVRVPLASRLGGTHPTGS